jgi:hypothetical protein
VVAEAPGFFYIPAGAADDVARTPPARSFFARAIADGKSGLLPIRLNRLFPTRH